MSTRAATDVTAGMDVTLLDRAAQRFQHAGGVWRRGADSRWGRNRLPSF
ncbi:hypothetical protein BZL30_6070 [Mycobacterium kansasii]|uniref:Uncharacterized protein n=1 Tax=Mycobacterium kansasii TaxID=1768 RepID=A0A1V3WW32_MYCKA|nr:hypothetical protein BZL30_6070 [Mycobacterium kansasii]